MSCRLSSSGVRIGLYAAVPPAHSLSLHRRFSLADTRVGSNLFDIVNWPLVNSTASGRSQRWTGGIVATEAAAAAQVRRPGCLQGELVAGHDVVAPHGAFGFHADNLIEIDAADGNKCDGTAVRVKAMTPTHVSQTTRPACA